jgi:hypothetical protein
VLNQFQAEMDNKLHEHLEIDHGDTITYFNVFDIGHGLTEIVLGSHDKEGKLTFNKTQMFFEQEQLKQLLNFFSQIDSKLRIRNQHLWMETIYQEIADNKEKQTDFVEDDADHVDNDRINLSRDIQDGILLKRKMRSSKNYCKRFYATLCNNQLHKEGQVISYSWRSTGGLIADILCVGDYLDWYCSGNEGYIDEEVEADLLTLGWAVKPYPEEEEDTTGDLF